MKSISKKTLFAILAVLIIIAIGAILFKFGVPGSNLQKNTTPNNVSQTVKDTKVSQSTAWVRDYQGLLPCADCAGTQTKLKLVADPVAGNTYALTSLEAGKKDAQESTETGSWKFMSNDNNMIQFTDSADGRAYYGRVDVNTKKLTYVTETGALFESSLPYELYEPGSIPNAGLMP